MPGSADRCSALMTKARFWAAAVTLGRPRIQSRSMRLYAEEASEFLGHGLLNILKSRSLQTDLTLLFQDSSSCFWNRKGRSTYYRDS
jgi:hypothetical protein